MDNHPQNTANMTTQQPSQQNLVAMRHQTEQPGPIDPIALAQRLSTMLDGELANKARLQAESTLGQQRKASSARRPSADHNEHVGASQDGIMHARSTQAQWEQAFLDRRVLTGSLPGWQFDHHTSMTSNNSATQQSQGRRMSTGGMQHQTGRKAAYVPQNAASQFCSTTTTETPTERAIKNRMCTASVHERGKFLNRGSLYPRSRKGSSLQHSTIPENPAGSEEQKTWEPKAIFETVSWVKSLEQDQADVPTSRKMSTISTVGMSESSRASISSFTSSRRGSTTVGSVGRRGSTTSYGSTINDHRVDWTQSDESKPKSPKLGTGGTRWGLKSRITNIGRRNKEPMDPDSKNEFVQAYVKELPTPPLSPTSPAPFTSAAANSSLSPKTPFFARFKH